MKISNLFEASIETSDVFIYQQHFTNRTKSHVIILYYICMSVQSVKKCNVYWDYFVFGHLSSHTIAFFIFIMQHNRWRKPT